jgi:hypothetical protein
MIVARVSYVPGMTPAVSDAELSILRGSTQRFEKCELHIDIGQQAVRHTATQQHTIGIRYSGGPIAIGDR